MPRLAKTLFCLANIPEKRGILAHFDGGLWCEIKGVKESFSAPDFHFTMSKNQTMSLFNGVPDEIICASSPPILAHQVLNQGDLGDGKISTKIATSVAVPTEAEAKHEQSESIASHTESSGSLELLPLQPTEGSIKEANEKGLRHWQTAAETLSQIAFRLASTTSAR